MATALTFENVYTRNLCGLSTEWNGLQNMAIALTFENVYTTYVCGLSPERNVLKNMATALTFENFSCTPLWAQFTIQHGESADF